MTEKEAIAHMLSLRGHEVPVAISEPQGFVTIKKLKTVFIAKEKGYHNAKKYEDKRKMMLQSNIFETEGRDDLLLNYITLCF